jgi:8-oxo-dGTP pyrophosphatase MutT (NUDIX family)
VDHHHPGNGRAGCNLLSSGVAVRIVTRRPAKQVAALPWRRKRKGIEILLITSRETRRWIIPKGWPVAGLQDYNAARREAMEEAGVEGRMLRKPLGKYDYLKRLPDGDTQPCRVTVFALEVAGRKKSWREKQQRKRKWFSAREAAMKVDEQGLRNIISILAN